MNEHETDLELGAANQVNAGPISKENEMGGAANCGPRELMQDMRCSITGQVILDPCIVSGSHACDAFDVAMQVTAQYLDGVSGPDICIYERHHRDSRVLCNNMKPGRIVYGVPMVRSWFRGAMTQNRIKVDVDVDGPWPRTFTRPGRKRLEGMWSVRKGRQRGDESTATIWYHSFRPDVLDRVGWADAPIHDLTFVYKQGDGKSTSSGTSHQLSQHTQLNDAWNRARDLQIALGTGPLLFYGKVIVRNPEDLPAFPEDLPALDGKRGQRNGGGTSGRETKETVHGPQRVILSGCLHYRDGARANGTFSVAGLLHGHSANPIGIRCPRGRSMFKARDWVSGEPVGSYSGEASTRLNPSSRYGFYGYWSRRGVAGSARRGREEWFSCAAPLSAAGATAAPGRDTVVHIVDKTAEGHHLRAGGSLSRTLEFQMTIKQVSVGISRVVGSPTSAIVKRVGFCWVHVYDQELDREFAVCFSGTVRWSNYDFIVSGPAISFLYVEDLGMFGHVNLTPLQRGWPTVGASQDDISRNWVRRMGSSDHICDVESHSAANERRSSLAEDSRASSQSDPYSDTVSVYAVSRTTDPGDAKRGGSFSPESSARYDEVDLGNHANRIVHAAHMRVKWVSNAWILACRDAVTSRASSHAASVE